VGAKKKPAYRVVVTDKRRARDSRSIEIVGHYNPTKDPIVLGLDEERVKYWISQGAQPSTTVQRLIKYEGPRTSPAEKATEPKSAGFTAPPPKPVEEPKAAEPVAAAEPEVATTEAAGDSTPEPVAEAKPEAVAPPEAPAVEESAETSTPAAEAKPEAVAPPEAPAVEESAETATPAAEASEPNEVKPE
jgi:small subunit ribosomal protein S16